MQSERVVPARFVYDSASGGMCRVEVELSPGRVVFVSVDNRLSDLADSKPISCRISETAQPSTSRLEILDASGRSVFEKNICVPDGDWRARDRSGPLSRA